MIIDLSKLAFTAASTDFVVFNYKPGEPTDCLCWFGDVITVGEEQEVGEGDPGGSVCVYLISGSHVS